MGIVVVAASAARRSSFASNRDKHGDALPNESSRQRGSR